MLVCVTAKAVGRVRRRVYGNGNGDDDDDDDGNLQAG